MTGWPIKKNENIEIRIIKSGNTHLWKLCEAIEYNTFRDCGYIGKNPSKRIDNFDIYSKMEFLAAFVGDKKIDYEEKRVAGVVRLVYAPNAEKMEKGMFPTIDHGEELNIYPEKLEALKQMDPRKIIDISTMSISKDKRDAKASKALISRIMTRVWQASPLRYAIAAVDTPFYEKLKSRNLPWEDLGPSTLYWGSMTTAGIIDAYKIPKGFNKVIIPYCKVKGYFQSKEVG